VFALDVQIATGTTRAVFYELHTEYYLPLFFVCQPSHATHSLRVRLGKKTNGFATSSSLMSLFNNCASRLLNGAASKLGFGFDCRLGGSYKGPCALKAKNVENSQRSFHGFCHGGCRFAQT